MKGDVQCFLDDFANTAVFRVEFDNPDMKDNHEPTSS